MSRSRKDPPAAKPGSPSARRAEARARLDAERSRQRSADRRQRLIVGLVVLVVVAVVAGGVTLQILRSRVSTASAVPVGAAGMGKGIALGASAASGKPVLDVYEDYACSACGAFQATSGPTVDSLVRSGKARVVFHMMDFIGPASKPAANAAACAASYGDYLAYHDILYKNQGSERVDWAPTNRLLAWGQQVGITNPAFAACVTQGTYNGYVDSVEAQAGREGVTQTPTIYLDGKPLPRSEYTPAGLTAAVAAAAKK